MPELTTDDEAKPVLDGDGNRIGIVTRVEDGTAYVDPADDVAGQLKTKLDWGSTTKDTYPLRNDAVAEITGDEIRLRGEYDTSGLSPRNYHYRIAGVGYHGQTRVVLPALITSSRRRVLRTNEPGYVQRRTGPDIVKNLGLTD